MESLHYSRGMQLAALPDINEVKPLDELDRACFRELRDVLLRYDRLDRFGVTLLHQHFDLADDEVLVETIDVKNRVQTITPQKRAGLTQAIETQWQLVDGEALLACRISCDPAGGHASFHSKV